VTEPSLFHFFGSREGLVAEALAVRFLRSQSELYGPWQIEVFKCRTRREFDSLNRRYWLNVVEPSRRRARQVRVETLAAVQAHPSLLEVISTAQKQANVYVTETIKHAQKKGWVRNDLNLEVFSFWVTAQATGVLVAELDHDEKILKELGLMIYKAIDAIMDPDS